MSAPGTAIVPALYEATVRHARGDPVRHAFAHRTYYWLIDVDDPPRLPAVMRPLARFVAEDHGGVPGAPLRAEVDRFLLGHGIDLDGGRVLMLAHARVLGHAFNPLSVYWCEHRDGTPACVVAEVSNTYGGRHRYLVRPNARGHDTVDKELYVSPFNGVDGYYTLAVPRPGERLSISVVLHREGHRPFVATVHGMRAPATPATLLRLAARTPVAPLLGAAQIRAHGIRLLLRGLPLVRRPARRGAPPPATTVRGETHEH